MPTVYFTVTHCNYNYVTFIFLSLKNNVQEDEVETKPRGMASNGCIIPHSIQVDT